MTKDITVYLEDILEAIEKISEYIVGTDEVGFSQNFVVQDAVIRRLAIIGEAAGKVPEDMQAKFPDIPWRQIAGLRNVVIHEYAGVSMGRVWRVIEKDLPALRTNIEHMKASLGAGKK